MRKCLYIFIQNENAFIKSDHVHMSTVQYWVYSMFQLHLWHELLKDKHEFLRTMFCVLAGADNVWFWVPLQGREVADSTILWLHQRLPYSCTEQRRFRWLWSSSLSHHTIHSSNNIFRRWIFILCCISMWKMNIKSSISCVSVNCLWGTVGLTKQAGCHLGLWEPNFWLDFWLNFRIIVCCCCVSGFMNGLWCRTCLLTFVHVQLWFIDVWSSPHHWFKFSNQW